VDLDQALQLAAASGGRLACDLAEAWSLDGRPHGGYVAALLERAATLAVHQPDARIRSISVNFLRPASIGPAEIEQLEAPCSPNPASSVCSSGSPAITILVDMTIHPRVTVNPMCTVASPLDEVLAIWDELGIHRVGLSAIQLNAQGWDPWLKAIKATDLDVVYLNYGIGAEVTDDSAWKQDESTLLRMVDAAAELGAGCIYFSPGPPGQVRWEEAVDRLGAQLSRVIVAAKGCAVAIGLENTVSSRPELGFLHSVRDAMTAARQLGVGVCVDLYGCWVEPALKQTLQDNVELIHLVQVSDFVVGTLVQPNRWVPGDGDLPLERLLNDVLDAGYQGVLDLELLGPAIAAEGPTSALARGTRWMTDVLQRRPG
jgi:sugar phosphate isomerase/epimerase